MVFSRAKTTDAKNGTASKTAFKKLLDFDSYRESADRLAELQSERRELQRTIAEIETQVGNDDDLGDVKAQAAELVSGGTAVAIARPGNRARVSA